MIVKIITFYTLIFEISQMLINPVILRFLVIVNLKQLVTWEFYINYKDRLILALTFFIKESSTATSFKIRWNAFLLASISSGSNPLNFS